MKRWIVVTGLVCGFHIAQSSTTAHAEPSTEVVERVASSPLTLEAVLASTELTYPSLLSAAKDRDLADADRMVAAGGFDPVFRTRGTTTPMGEYNYLTLDSTIRQPTSIWGTEIFVGYKLGVGSIPDYDGKLKTLSGGELRAGVVVPLFRDGAIDSRRAAVWSTAFAPKIAELGIAASRLDALRVASLRYWAWVEAGRAVAVQKELLKLAQLRDLQFARSVEKGAEAAIVRLDNTRSILAREGALISSERALASAGIELSLFLRDNKGTPIAPVGSALPDSLPEPRAASILSFEEEVSRALSRRPEFARLIAQRRQFELEARLAKNSLLPEIDLIATISRDFGRASDEKYAYLDKTVLEVGIFIDIPLLARAASGKLKSATAKQEKLDIQLQFLRERVAADIKDALVAEATARQRVALARKELDLARKVEEAERKAFDLGNSTLLVVNLREQATADASLRELAALSDWSRAMAVYRAVTGVL